jgi:hypothetical protein
MSSCLEDERARGPAGMSVSKHPTWNRTTSLELAYWGRSRRCHHPLQPVRLPRHLHHRHCWPQAGHRRNGPATGLPALRVISSRRKERRVQRLRDIPVAGPVEVIWSKYRWYCEETACDRLSFFESMTQVPRRARSTGRLRDHLVAAVIRSSRAVSETAAGFSVSWWMVRAALNESCLLRLPDVDRLSPRMLGIDERRFRSVRYFQDTATKAWTRFEPWMTTIVYLDASQVLGVVDGRDHKGVGEWLFAVPWIGA